MSTRFEAASSEGASLASVSIWAADDQTFAGYVYFHALPAAKSLIIQLFDGSNGWSVQITSTGKLRVENLQSGATVDGATTYAINTWYYLWIRRETGSGIVYVYVDASASIEVQRGTTNAATATLTFAAPNADGTSGDISLCGWKSWTDDRAATNATAEKAQHLPVSTTNCVGAWEFAGADVTDHHSSGNNLTASGTLSAGPNSPIDGGITAWGPQLAMQLNRLVQ